MGSASDPKATVTGYPAAHGGAGGAPAFAYAYPAPPPHAAPYYAAPPPAAPGTCYAPYNIPYQYPSRSTTLLRRLIAIATGVFLVMAAVTVIRWLVLGPRVPEFSISSATVSGFNLSSSSQILSSQFDFTISVRNPNQKLSVQYERVHAAVFYRSDSIAETSLPPLDQPKENVTDVKARMAAAEEYVGSDAAAGIAGERSGGDGGVTFNVGIQGWVMFKSGDWTTGVHVFRVYCERIRIGLKDATASTGSLVGPARMCRVAL